MKRILILLSMLALSAGHATWCCQPQDCSFYVKVGSGVSFSRPLDVKVTPVWTVTDQGYNSAAGNTPIAELSLGCEFSRLIDLEVGISNRSTFEYRKFQNPVGSDGSFTREFDLDVTSVLFSLNVLGRDISCLNWNCGCGSIYPIVGLGVGVSDLTITNFRTTGLPPSGSSSPFPDFANENQHTLRRNFTYTALFGLEYNCNDCWALSTGYRFFNAGKFKGPRFIRTNTGGAIDLVNNEWKMYFKANEWFIELKVFL